MHTLMHLCLCLLLTPRTFLFHPNPVPVMHSAPVADTTASAASNTSSVAYCDDKGQVLLLVLSLVCYFLNRAVLLGWLHYFTAHLSKKSSILVASKMRILMSFILLIIIFILLLTSLCCWVCSRIFWFWKIDFTHEPQFS